MSDIADRQVHSPGLVGRVADLESLVTAIGTPPAVVLVEGEAGIGKSRLIRELRHRLDPAGRAGPPTVLVGVCPPFREPYTLAPVVEALRHAGGQVAGLALSPLAGALRPLFPEWAAELPPAPEPAQDARAGRHRLLRALAELLDLLAAVLVVEDAHWADQLTLELLLFLASRQDAPDSRASLIVTYRPEDLPAGSLLLGLSSRPPAGGTQLRVTLRPLDVAQTAAFVSSMLQEAQVSEAFATFLRDRTGGVPLALEESIRLLGDRADLVRQDGQWVRLGLDQLQVPASVRDATRQRMQRLKPAAAQVLRAAAVLAEPVTEATLRSVAGLPPAVARAGTAGALAAGLLVDEPPGRLAFRHVLSARAVYDAIPGPERRRLHLRAGRALEQLQPVPAAALTRHFREAAAVAKWCHYAEQASQHAAASNDHTTAIVLLLDVLTHADLATPMRVRLTRRLALATLAGQDYAVDHLTRQVVEALRAVLEQPALDGRQQGELRSLLGRLLMQCGDWEGAHQSLEQTIPYLGDDPEAAARVLIYLAWPLAGPAPGSARLRLLERAAEFERAVSSPVERLSLAVDRVTALLVLGDESGWALAAELPTDPASAAERAQVARGCANIGMAAREWGRYAAARHWLDTALRLSDEIDYRRLRPNVLIELALLDWDTGNWGELADRVAALEVADQGWSASLRTRTILEGRMLMRAGHWQEAEECFRSLPDRGAGSTEAAADLARLWLADGRVEEALRVTEQSAHEAMTRGTWLWKSYLALVRLDALVAAGSLGAAAELLADFEAASRGRHAPAATAAAATGRAILAQGRDGPAPAAHLFAAASRAWQSLPNPYEALRARERQANCLLATPHARDGLALLGEVWRDLSELGAAGDAERVAQRLRQHGVGVRRPSRGGRPGYGDRLSPRELEVVRLVIAGRTNREIGRVLSRSPKTVAAQLQAAMRKLQAPSRTALAVHASNAGISPDDRAPPDR